MALRWVKKHVLLMSFYRQNIILLAILCLAWVFVYSAVFYAGQNISFKDFGFLKKAVILILYYGLNTFSIVYIKKKMAVNLMCKKNILPIIVSVFVSLTIYTIIFYMSFFISSLFQPGLKTIEITHPCVLLILKFLPVGIAVYFLQHIYDAVLCIKQCAGVKDFILRYSSAYKKFSFLPFLCFILNSTKMIFLYYYFSTALSLLLVITAEVMNFFASAAMIERYDEEMTVLRM